MIKLIASDMDGTLLRHDQTISSFNIKAIRAAAEHGVEFIVATGRGYNSVQQLQNKFGFSCDNILLNGAELRTKDGTVVDSIELTKNKVRDIIRILKPYGIIIHYMTSDGVIVTDSKEAVLADMQRRMDSFRHHFTDEEFANFSKRDHLANLKFIDNIETLFQQNIKIFKIEAFYEDQDEVLSINNQLKRMKGVAVASASLNSIEVTDFDATKGNMISKYAHSLGIKTEEVAVIGDSLNDESMFRMFPHSYAMNNAMEELKKIANEVVEDNVDDGVGKTIFRILENQ